MRQKLQTIDFSISLLRSPLGKKADAEVIHAAIEKRRTYQWMLKHLERPLWRCNK
jgi:hypothetical protein